MAVRACSLLVLFFDRMTLLRPVVLNGPGRVRGAVVPSHVPPYGATWFSNGFGLVRTGLLSDNPTSDRSQHISRESVTAHRRGNTVPCSCQQIDWQHIHIITHLPRTHPSRAGSGVDMDMDIDITF